MSLLKKMMKRTNQSAFTLLEIMIVVSIIVILLGLAISKMGNPIAPTKAVAVRADIQSIGTQLMQYNAMNGFYPTTEQGLQALVTQPESEPRPNRWFRSFEKIPTDPYGSPYIYRCPGIKHSDKYDLYSAGPNRIDDNGAGDDDWGE
jgi:general secretion pathway protein G